MRAMVAVAVLLVAFSPGVAGDKKDKLPVVAASDTHLYEITKVERPQGQVPAYYLRRIAIVDLKE
jgi:hypothetical protein